MKQLLQFLACVFLGAVLQRYLINRSPNLNSYSTESHSEAIEKQFSFSEKVSRKDVTGEVPATTELREFSVSESTGNGTLSFIEVTAGVYVAYGYAHGNVIVLEGPDGLVIVDTTESLGAAAFIRKELRNFNSKPIKAIVLTHFHPDHINGVQEFIEDKSNPPDVWAFHTMKEIIRSHAVFGPKATRGGVHQMGLVLEQDRLFPRLPHGLGPAEPYWPNKLVKEEVENVTLAGLNITFLHLPGETDDHIVVWLPDSRVVLPGDNFYRAFPNIYSIRGTPARDALAWARSVRQMRCLDADHIAPAHGIPISGRQKIYDLLTVYSSAIFFVHDQTVKRMNEFKHPDEIARSIQLPTALANHPYLYQGYGLVEWASKGIYMKYAGWFSGDPVDLLPLTPSERSQAYIDLIGVDRILSAVESALRSGQSQLALEFSSHVYRVQPQNLRAKWLRLQALRDQAAKQNNPLVRNYYLTAALDSYGYINWNWKAESTGIDVSLALELMKYRVKDEMTDGVNTTVFVHFSDIKMTYRLQILYSVLEVEKLCSDDEVKLPVNVPRLTTTEKVWLDIILGKTPAATAFSNGLFTVDGSLADVRKFMSYFLTL